MACNCHSLTPLSKSIHLSGQFLLKSRFAGFSFQTPANLSSLCLSNRYSVNCPTFSAKAKGFTWDDVVREGQSEDSLSDLSGYFDKIGACNRNTDKHSEFLPFVIENQTVGYVHHGFAETLRRFKDVFLFGQSSDGPSNGYVTLQATLKTAEERTCAVGDVIKSLGADMIPGIRNELYPVTSCFGAKELFALERAAAPYFGIKAYGVHMNGYVERDEEKFLWIGKRSQVKPTFPGMLDHLVAGGLPHGISASESMIKECEEEAGILPSISSKVRAAGAVSYADIDGYRYKRDVLFCYDLNVPADFVPHNQDGEVESFKLISIGHVANVIKRTQFFKSNCCLVIIDFLIRQGYITPDSPGYLKLLQSLRSGDCS